LSPNQGEWAEVGTGGGLGTRRRVKRTVIRSGHGGCCATRGQLREVADGPPSGILRRRWPLKVSRAIAVVLGSMFLVTMGSGSAFAGEVNGNQQPIPATKFAHSICAFSGQNNFNEPTEPGRTQSYGQIVAAGGKAFAPSPGVACNGHRGFLVNPPPGEAP
jgi:hypothetical protein